MAKAFIMIKLGSSAYTGLSESAPERSSKTNDVGSSYAVFGRYDVVAEVAVRNLNAFSQAHALDEDCSPFRLAGCQ
jgi:hypothetical protein